MKKLRATLYPPVELDRMIRLLAGVRGKSYNAIVIEAIEKLLKEAIDSGEFSRVPDAVEAFKGKRSA